MRLAIVTGVRVAVLPHSQPAWYRPVSLSLTLSQRFSTAASNTSTMATARKIHLSPLTDSGVWSTGVTEASARAASEVLQEDLDKHHVFFNNMGFHSMSSAGMIQQEK